ncbi:MAG TPA: hypothetical protein VK961_12315 [Chthoniobacter sp.]|nr:hypothetical protein [Chthoniobacter sp.]
MRHGAYPETLAELAPEFIEQLPVDIDAGAAFHYQRVGEASFRLYGVGANGQDDGGQFTIGVAERNQLDAVWPYSPAPSAP